MHLWLIINVKKEKEKTEELAYMETSVGHISFMFIKKSVISRKPL